LKGTGKREVPRQAHISVVAKEERGKVLTIKLGSRVRITKEGEAIGPSQKMLDEGN